MHNKTRKKLVGMVFCIIALSLWYLLSRSPLKPMSTIRPVPNMTSNGKKSIRPKEGIGQPKKVQKVNNPNQPTSKISPLLAGCFEKFNRLQLSEKAKVIVVGQCTDIKYGWNEKKTLISTYATYQTDQAVKGALDQQEVVVKSLGGTVGRITQTTVGGPQFSVGERNLLFLTDSDEPNAFRLVGLNQGKVDIQTDSKSGTDMVIGGDAVDLTPLSLKGTIPSAQTYFKNTEPLKSIIHEIKQQLQITNK